MDTKEKYSRSDHLHKDKGTGESYPVHDIHDFNTGKLVHFAGKDFHKVVNEGK